MREKFICDVCDTNGLPLLAAFFVCGNLPLAASVLTGPILNTNKVKVIS